MPVYEVQGPDGKTYEVEAPSPQAAGKAIASLASPKYDGSEYGTAADSGSAGSNFLAGIGKGFVDVGRALGQPFGIVDQADIEASRRRDAPLMDTGTGLAGNILGSATAMAPTAMIPGANTLAGAAAIGAGTGALMTPGTIGERAAAGALGGIGNVGGVVAGRAISGAGQGVKALVEPFTKGGREKIAARTVQRFAGDAATAAQAADNAAQFVPGSLPTLAEATGDPGLAQLQRGLMASDPQTAAALANRETANRAARAGVLSGIGKDDAAMEAAIQARKAATNPLYSAVAKSDQLADPSRVVSLIDRMQKANPANKALMGPLNEIRESLFESYPEAQRGADAWKALNDALSGRNFSAPGSLDIKAARTVLDRVRKGNLSADEALQELRGIKPKNKAFAGAIDYAKQTLKTPNYVIRQNPQQLMSAVDNVKALLGKQENAFVKRELTTVKKSLEHQLSKAVPEYGQASKTFASMSAPINQMQIGRQLYDKLGPALNDFGAMGETPAMFARELRNADQLVKNATGMRSMSLEKILTPQQLTAIQGVGKDLARAQNISAGRGVGSNTAQNLSSQNLLRRTLGPLGMPESWMEGTVLPALMGPARLAQFAYNAMPEQKIQQLLADAVLDPKLAAKLLKTALDEKPGLLRLAPPAAGLLGQATAYGLLQ